jgi:hypothetical protein
VNYLGSTHVPLSEVGSTFVGSAREEAQHYGMLQPRQCARRHRSPWMESGNGTDVHSKHLAPRTFSEP